jgi:histidinol-phosphate aminotransferase
MPSSSRAALRKIDQAEHGGINYRRLAGEGYRPEDILDFSVSINPFGHPPQVLEAIRRIDPTRYPDTDANALREILAKKHDLDPGKILVTNGTAQAIWLVALAFVEPDDRTLIPSPTFSEFNRAGQLMGAAQECVWADEMHYYKFDIDKLIDRMGELQPRVTWLCNPNNPSGSYLSEAEVSALLACCQSYGGFLVIDEAYVQFVEQPWDTTRLLDSRHLILLRSMTKDYALAGLRLGYIVASAQVIAALRKAQPPWSINAGAQAGGVAVLGEETYYKGCWRKLRNLTCGLQHSLLAVGYRVLPTETNFMLVHIGSNKNLHTHLWADRILIRDCTSFGMPHYVRIATRLEEDNQRLIRSMKAYREAEAWES